MVIFLLEEHDRDGMLTERLVFSSLQKVNKFIEGKTFGGGLFDERFGVGATGYIVGKYRDGNFYLSALELDAACEPAIVDSDDLDDIEIQDWDDD